MAFRGKKNKSSEHKGNGLKKASGNASSEGLKKPTGVESVPKAPQKRVLGTASLADILGLSPKLAAPKKEVSVPKKWEPFYRKLLRLQTLLTDGNTMPEAGDEELLEFVFDRSQTLAEVKDAIERIFKGTYGICELTRKPIEPQRLAAIPYARYSLEGQRQLEELRSDALSSGEEEEEQDETASPYPSDDDADE